MMFVLVVIAIIIMFSIYQRSLPTGNSQDDAAEWTDMSECRGYIGIIGAVITLVGVCIPFVTIFFISYSFLDILMQISAAITVISIMLLALEIVLYATGHHGGACALAVLLTAAFFIGMFNDDNLTFKEILDMVEFGFWVTSTGLILMCTSPFMKKLNLTIRDILTT